MFIRNAQQGNNAWYLYPLMIFILFLAYSIGQMPLMGVIWYALDKNPELGSEDLERVLTNMDFSLVGISLNTGFLLLLLMFVFAFIALYFLFPAFHQRSFKTLITWEKSVNWGKILFGFFVWLGLGLMIESVFFGLNPEAYTFQFSLSKFIPLLLISILILPIQTSAEELVFRGYLMQGIGVASKSRWIPLIITSILFGLIHSMNPEIEKFGFIAMQIYYLSAGLLLGILTLMDDSLELALGVHAATNFIGAVFVGYDGAAIQTNSLFRTSTVNTTWMTFAFLIVAIIFIFICKKKYHWGSFRKLIEPIETPINA